MRKTAGFLLCVVIMIGSIGCSNQVNNDNSVPVSASALTGNSYGSIEEMQKDVTGFWIAYKDGAPYWSMGFEKNKFSFYKILSDSKWQAYGTTDIPIEFHPVEGFVRTGYGDCYIEDNDGLMFMWGDLVLKKALTSVEIAEEPAEGAAPYESGNQNSKADNSVSRLDYSLTKGANGHYTYRCLKICSEKCGNPCKTCLMNGKSFHRSPECNFDYGASKEIGWIGCPDCGDVSHEKWYDWYRKALGLS